MDAVLVGLALDAVGTQCTQYAWLVHKKLLFVGSFLFFYFYLVFVLTLEVPETKVR